MKPMIFFVLILVARLFFNQTIRINNLKFISFFFSLANVLLQSPASTPLTESKVNFPSDSSLPGLMNHMTSRNINTLISCLDLSYQASILFDSRPGLKFLVQRVAGLERAANLYRQAGAAWVIKVVVLFELCLSHGQKNKLDPEQIKELLENVNAECNDDFRLFFHKLQENFNELCETYIDVILDKDGAHTSLDKVPDQPIFFLIACQDDQLPEIKKPVKEEEKEEVEENPPKSGENSPSKTPPPPGKPFVFSDFAKDLSDTSCESDFEIDESPNRPENFDNEEAVKNEKTEEEIKENHDEITPEKDEKFPDKNVLSDVLNEYKRSKKKHSVAHRRNPFNPAVAPPPAIPPEIEMQRRKSFLKVRFFKFFLLQRRFFNLKSRSETKNCSISKRRLRPAIIHVTPTVQNIKKIRYIIN